MSNTDSNSSSLNNSFQGFHSQSWAQSIAQLEDSGINYVIATVIGTSGSTPRASGTKMVISDNNIYDTLGGGHLEFVVIEKARELLIQGKSVQLIEQFHLAANLGQCCGGAATILFEVIASEHMQLDVYGAGHVAQALIPILAKLPVQVRWIDNREDVFPQHIPSNVKKVIDEFPVEQAKQAKANTAFLILTHNHQLDFELTEAILKRNDAFWLGVIGSDTKAKRFRHRLSHREFSASDIEKMICPVGISEVNGKLPMEVAVSISGQIIQLYQQYKLDVGHTVKQGSREGLQWKTLKNSLVLSQSEDELAMSETALKESTSEQEKKMKAQVISE